MKQTPIKPGSIKFKEHFASSFAVHRIWLFGYTLTLYKIEKKLTYFFKRFNKILLSLMYQETDEGFSILMEAD